MSGRAPWPRPTPGCWALTDWKVPLTDVVIAEGDIDAVAETYRSGWLSMGPRTEEFEQRFARFVGARHAVAVTNGTAALHLSCAASGLGEGDEVIVPSLTFVATASAIRYTGATPVFADIAGLERPWMSASSVAEVIGERTKAIMNVIYGGHPGESKELADLAADRGLLLLEDAAHGVGGRLGGRHLGTFGRAGAFSFFSNKNLPIGEGGMLVTDDDELASTARLLRSHGMTSLTWDRHRGHATDYDVTRIGFNYRIDEARAALAIQRLARLDEENQMRAHAEALYRERLEQLDGLVPTMPPIPGSVPAHHLFTVVLDERVDRDRTRKRLADMGIQTSLHYSPVHRFTAYGVDSHVPLTDEYAARAVTLPLFPGIDDEQIELVVEGLRKALTDR
jgi:dTDP-4-amino-4,6-dideoxygalactose transaminase